MLRLQIRVIFTAPGPSMRTLLRIVSQHPYRSCFTSLRPIPQVSQFHSASKACKLTRLQCASHYSASAAESPKAAALVIGNEILNGSVVDTNTPWLAKLLHSRGVDLVRAEYVPDDEADIGSTVLRLKERVGPGGFVFTSGGIGATHDDVTYSAIAAAFGTELQLHAPTVERMRENYSKRGVELNEARLRMATLPAAAEVFYTPDLWVPLVNLHGVYILPGIPRLFKAMIEANKEPFKGPQSKFRVLYTNTVEGDLADALRAIAEKHPTVGIGSYPNTAELDAQQSYRVKLQLVSRDEQALEAAVEEVKQGIDCLRDISSGS